MLRCFFFFNDTATTEIYTLSLHDALPIFSQPQGQAEAAGHEAPPPGAEHGGDQPDAERGEHRPGVDRPQAVQDGVAAQPREQRRSEEHTSELQSRQYLVCRLLLEKNKHML